jgi:Relaxase/Mobilisation nuclease domain
MMIFNNPSKSVSTLVYYNERKVKAGDARCISGGNFLMDVGSLTAAEKAKVFRNIISLNQRAEWTMRHFFLDFAPAEQFSDSRMSAIAMTYMDGIGFGKQPYLVYRHLDTAFPHLHIVTTNIRWDGSELDYYKLGWRRSDRIQKSIELQFGLQSGVLVDLSLPGHDPGSKIQYGKMPTTRAIGESLDFILHAYKYRSLEELNAILRLYNVRAIGGQPGSLLHTHRGLLYQILDDNGKGRGMPVKASALYFKPVFKWLEERFEANRVVDATALGRVRFALDGVIRGGPAGSVELLGALRRQQLAASAVFGKNGEVDGLFFVDLASKAVFSSVDLGHGYDAAAMRERLGFDPFPAPEKRRGRRLPVEPVVPIQTPVTKQVKQKGRSRHL